MSGKTRARAGGSRAEAKPALTIRDLQVVTQPAGAVVLSGVSFDAVPGEVLALVGESGSGKTTAALAALGYVRRDLHMAGGTVRLRPTSPNGQRNDPDGLGGSQARDGQAGSDGRENQDRQELVDIHQAGPADLRRLRGRFISYVPQDPAASLNPAIRIGKQIREVLDVHSYGSSDAERAARTVEVLEEVGLPSDHDFACRYPHQLSGGQQQRVGIAAAFACRPSVIVLDEPTTGLDVTTQAHVLETVRRLSSDFGVASVYITHDLAVVAEIADRVAVLQEGSLVEVGDVNAVLRSPKHPYTQRLVAAVPDLRRGGAVVSERVPCEAEGSLAVLAVRDLSYRFGAQDVLRNVNLDLLQGECTMLLGESGSGKTTASRCVAGLRPDYRGTVSLDGQPLARSTRRRTNEQRRRVQYVFQNPYSSLNPRKTVGESMAVPLRVLGTSKVEQTKLVREMLERVGLDVAFADRFPGQLSGGQRQRVAIGRALIGGPDVLICDEVTSALDVSVQAAIVDLLRTLQQESGMAMLFVTHNVALAREVAQRVAVLEKGRIVESGTVEEIVERPSHPYTQELIANTPSL